MEPPPEIQAEMAEGYGGDREAPAAPKQPTLAGTWCKPERFLIEEGDAEGEFKCEKQYNGMTFQFDKKTRAVTVVITHGGDMTDEFTGKVSIEMNRITFDNGIVWTRDKGCDKGMFMDWMLGNDRDEEVEEADNLLSRNQKNTVVMRCNEALDIPLFTESAEDSIIHKAVTSANENLKDALMTFMQEDWKNCISILLDEQMSIETKTEEIQAIIGRQVRVPLAAYLNEKIDIPIMSEEYEGKMFDTIIDKILDAIVAQSVKGMEATGFV